MESRFPKGIRGAEETQGIVEEGRREIGSRGEGSVKHWLSRALPD